LSFVASVKTPDDLAPAAQLLASAAGLVPAEARMRLAPEPPALLIALPPSEALALCAELLSVGLAAVVLDQPVPDDGSRVVARRLDFDDEDMVVIPRSGPPLVLPWPQVRMVLRGARSARTESTSVESKRKLAIGTAAITGGLKMTRDVKRTVVSGSTTTTQVLLVYGAEGQCAALYESEIIFDFLGPLMQPTRMGNMGVIADEIRRRAPTAWYDDRLIRLGRRRLPFVGDGRSARSTFTATESTVHTDTGAVIDVLAEVLREAHAQGLLP
jgi:hypothetical protein